MLQYTAVNFMMDGRRFMKSRKEKNHSGRDLSAAESPRKENDRFMLLGTAIPLGGGAHAAQHDSKRCLTESC